MHERHATVDFWEASEFPYDVPEELPICSKILPRGYWFAVEYGDDGPCVHLMRNADASDDAVADAIAAVEKRGEA